MKTTKFDNVIYSSQDEKEITKKLTEYFKASPLPDDEILSNLGLYLTSKTLARLLFFYEIYKKIVTTHGIIIELGPRWGQTISLLSALRGIFEPFNRHRKLIGFDTFEGLKGISKEDIGVIHSRDGAYSVTPGYEDYLDQILAFQELLNPVPHVKKYEIVKGDVIETLPLYLKEHPETIISLIIFDLDIYKPTKAAMETIKPYLFKGSIVVFDELCDALFPGETIALNEVFGFNNVRLQRFPMTSRLSFMEIE